MLEIRKLLREAEAPAIERSCLLKGVDNSCRFGKGRSIHVEEACRDVDESKKLDEVHVLQTVVGKS